MLIYFAIQCHNFQWRLCWQLSSIVEQQGKGTKRGNEHREYAKKYRRLAELPQIVVDVACMPNNGHPDTESIATAFQHQGLDVRLTTVKDRATFGKRGLVRNLQLDNAYAAHADWIYFADCDHIYAPDYFSKLGYRLRKKYAKCDNVITCPHKWHTTKPEADALARLAKSKPFLSNAYERVHALPHTGKRNAPIAAGCCQIIRPDVIWAKNDGLYCTPAQCRDSDMFKKQAARSDLWFRRRMGGTTTIWDIPLQIHMDHDRDKEFGYHIEEQR